MRSKHFQLVVLLFFMVYTAVYAQNVRFGVQAGGGVASAYNYYPEKNEYTSDPLLGIAKNYLVPSYSLNLYFSVPLKEKIAVAIEPGIIQKGFSTKQISQNDLLHNRTFLTYVQMPVLLEFCFENPITVSVGAEFGYLIKARWKNNDEATDDIMNYYKKNKIDAGLQFGIFYTFAGYFDLGLKTAGSFTNLEKHYLTDENGQVLAGVGKKATYLNAFARVKL